MRVRWLGEACVEIIGEQTMLIDPNYQVEPEENPDLILVTHEHDDHFDPEVRKKFPGAELYAPQSVYDEFDVAGEVVTAGEEFGPGIKVLDCDCYGSEEAVGYYYQGVLHTADAAQFPIPEAEVKLAFSACFTDFQEEYLASCRQVEPELVVPYHYTAGEEEGIAEAKSLVKKLTANGFTSQLLEAGAEVKL